MASAHSEKKEHPKEKSELHPRNRHRERYNFEQLILSYPPLRAFVKLNKYGDESIDFFDPEAVKNLNRALLRHFYGIEFWDIPKNYLCPPIPGRADYIHYAADLLASENQNEIPRGDRIKCLDIGVGANCIYPIIGTSDYGWQFVGADIDRVAISSAIHIVASNHILKERIVCRLQPDSKKFLHNVIKKGEHFDLTLCNPPFHASAADAKTGTLRKLSNLKGKKMTKPVLNFGGQSNELWCEGGEKRFVSDLIRESKEYKNSCLWFTTLVSRQWNINPALSVLKSVNAAEIKTIHMSQGNKSSRILAWTFLSPEKRKLWVSEHWK